MSLRLCSRAPRMMSWSATGCPLAGRLADLVGVRTHVRPPTRCRRKPATPHRQSDPTRSRQRRPHSRLADRPTGDPAGGRWCWMARMSTRPRARPSRPARRCVVHAAARTVDGFHGDDWQRPVAPAPAGRAPTWSPTSRSTPKAWPEPSTASWPTTQRRAAARCTTPTRSATATSTDLADRPPDRAPRPPAGRYDDPPRRVRRDARRPRGTAGSSARRADARCAPRRCRACGCASSRSTTSTSARATRRPTGREAFAIHLLDAMTKRLDPPERFEVRPLDVDRTWVLGPDGDDARGRHRPGRRHRLVADRPARLPTPCPARAASSPSIEGW